MSWDTMMPLLFRQVIGDTDPTSPKYTDESLGNTLLAAAQFVQVRTPFVQKYSVDPENFSLTPDPTEDATRDDPFINIVILKAACMLLTAEVRTYGQQAIAIRDGTSAIDLKRDLKSLQLLANGYCQELEKAVNDYLHNQYIPGEAIVGPYKAIVARLERCMYIPRDCRC